MFICKACLHWLSHAARPLEVDELERALMLNDRQNSHHDDRIVGFESTIYLACAGLVECTSLWNSDIQARCTRTCKFIHLSVKDYLLSHDDSIWQLTRKDESRRTFIPPAAVCHLELAACCLKQLLYANPLQPLSTLSAPEASYRLFDSVLPFSSYAASYWMDHHLRLSNPIFQMHDYDAPAVFQKTLKILLKDLSVFLHNPKATSAWLEMFYATIPDKAERPDAEVLHSWSTDLSRFMENHPGLVDGLIAQNEVQEFSFVLAKVNQEWGHNLSQRPESVWDEMGAFVQSVYFVQSETTVVRSRPPQSSESPDSKTAPLAYISLSNHLSLAVLSVWPSK